MSEKPHKCDLCPKSKRIPDGEDLASFSEYGPFRGLSVGITGRKFEVFSEVSPLKKKKFKEISQLSSLSLCLDHAKEVEKSVTGEVGYWAENWTNLENEVSTVRRRR